MTKRESSIMDIISAYNNTGSYAAAAKICGCSPNTVKKYVRQRNEGIPSPVRAPRVVDTPEHIGMVEELVTKSEGHIMAKIVYERLQTAGYTKSYRSCCRLVREAKNRFRAGKLRVHRPWVPSPGEWMQFDYGDGPVVDGRKTILFVAWMPWSKARFAMPLVDKKLPSVVEAIDAAFRYFGGVPRYVLTDNERTITVDQVCNLSVRNAKIVEFARWYGTNIQTCKPYDPASKGGVENAVKIAKNDLVPSNVNLRENYSSFADLVAACQAWCNDINSKVNSAGFIPRERLEAEHAHLNPLPVNPFAVLDGPERCVATKSPMISFEGAHYSVPSALMGKKVQVRANRVTATLTITHRASDGSATQVAVHPILPRGEMSINDDHFPANQPTGPLNRKIMATNDVEKQFLAIGDGAHAFIAAAAACGKGHVRERLSHILALAPTWGNDRLNIALQRAAAAERVTLADVESILNTADIAVPEAKPIPRIDDSYAQGTSAWAALNERNAS